MEPDTANVAWLQNDPRWRPPAVSHGLSTVRRMGPPPSELRRRCVLLHHGSGPYRTYRIQVCGAMICAEWRAPPRTVLLPTSALVRDERSAPGANRTRP